MREIEAKMLILDSILSRPDEYGSIYRNMTNSHWMLFIEGLEHIQDIYGPKKAVNFIRISRGLKPIQF